jgi:FtsZ-interacting cell division protein ZipA
MKIQLLLLGLIYAKSSQYQTGFRTENDLEEYDEYPYNEYQSDAEQTQRLPQFYEDDSSSYQQSLDKLFDQEYEESDEKSEQLQYSSENNENHYQLKGNEQDVTFQDQDFEDEETQDFEDEQDYNLDKEESKPKKMQSKTKESKKQKNLTGKKAEKAPAKKKGNPVLFFSVIGGFVGFVIIGAVFYRVMQKRRESKETTQPLLV